jgi:hypothetical protein
MPFRRGSDSAAPLKPTDWRERIPSCEGTTGWRAHRVSLVARARDGHRDRYRLATERRGSALAHDLLDRCRRDRAPGAGQVFRARIPGGSCKLGLGGVRARSPVRRICGAPCERYRRVTGHAPAGATGSRRGPGSDLSSLRPSDPGRIGTHHRITRVARFQNSRVPSACDTPGCLNRGVETPRSLKLGAPWRI